MTQTRPLARNLEELRVELERRMAAAAEEPDAVDAADDEQETG